MSVTDPGDEFWDNLAAEQDFLDHDAKDTWAHENEEIVDKGNDSLGTGTPDLMADSSFGLSSASPTTEVAKNDLIGDAAFDAAEVSLCAKKAIFTHISHC